MASPDPSPRRGPACPRVRLPDCLPVKLCGFRPVSRPLWAQEDLVHHLRPQHLFPPQRREGWGDPHALIHLAEAPGALGTHCASGSADHRPEHGALRAPCPRRSVPLVCSQLPAARRTPWARPRPREGGLAGLTPSFLLEELRPGVWVTCLRDSELVPIHPHVPGPGLHRLLPTEPTHPAVSSQPPRSGPS